MAALVLPGCQVSMTGRDTQAHPAQTDRLQGCDGGGGRGYRDLEFGLVSESALIAELPVTLGRATYRLRLGAG